MRRTPQLFAGGLLCALLALGCDRNGEPVSVAPAPNTQEGAQALPSSHSDKAAAPSLVRGRAACRVMKLSGDIVTALGESLVQGQMVLGDGWVSLSDGATLYLKHTGSGREFRVDGPGRVLPCVQGREEIMVGGGTLQTEASAGSRPGAQVVVGTPFGTLRYASARARLTVSASELGVTVQAGEVWLAPAQASSGPEVHLQSKQPLRRGLADRVDAEAAASRCGRAATASRSLAEGLLKPGEAGLGQRAAAHVRARNEARTACAVAVSATLQQHSGSALSSRLGEISKYDELWQGVPGASG